MPGRLSVAAGAVVLLAGGCSVSPGDKVVVGLREWAIEVGPTSVRSGRVQFEIDNEGDLTHNLVLMRKSDVSELALTPEGAVDVAVDRPIDEIENLGPGNYLAVSPNVLAGDYLVVCTITEGTDGQPLNHFQAGMWAKLKVVTKAAAEAPAP
jgi:hypothetical protein